MGNVIIKERKIVERTLVLAGSLSVNFLEIVNDVKSKQTFNMQNGRIIHEEETFEFLKSSLFIKDENENEILIIENEQ